MKHNPITTHLNRKSRPKCSSARHFMIVCVSILSIITLGSGAQGGNEAPGIAASAAVQAAPKITKHPDNIVSYVGGSVTFTAAAEGTEPLSYQWRFNGIDIPGANGSTLTLDNISSQHAGGYTLMVSNTAGNATSRIGHISVAANANTPLQYELCPRGSLYRMVFRDVIYSGAAFVAAGDRGVMATSTDGAAWQPQDSGLSTRLSGIAVGNGLMVAVGAEGYILTSPDGINWAPRNSGTQVSLASVAFGAGKFVAVGASGMVTTSTDGISWTRGRSARAATWTSVTFANGLFVAVGGGGAIMTSEDGVLWKARASGVASHLKRVIYGGGVFLATGSRRTTLTSSDGKRWAKHILKPSSSQNPQAIYPDTFMAAGFGNGLLVVASTPITETYKNLVYGRSEVWASSDGGQTWSEIGAPDSFGWPNLSAMAFNGTRFVLFGRGSHYTSSDGVSWEEVKDDDYHTNYPHLIDQGGPSFITEANGSYLGAGGLLQKPSAGFTFTSSDGFDWASHQVSTGRTPNIISYGDGIYTAYFRGDDDSGWGFYSSPDGVAWTQRVRTLVSTGSDYTIQSFYYGGGFLNGQFVYVGEDDAGPHTGAIARSVDGITWDVKRIGAKRLYSVAYGGGLFVAVGANGAIFTSPDATTWTARLSGVIDDITSISFKDGKFIAIARGGSVTPMASLVISNDGVSWIQKRSRTLFRTDASAISVAHIQGRFIACVRDFIDSFRLFESKDSMIWKASSRRRPYFYGEGDDGELFSLGDRAFMLSDPLYELLARPTLRAKPTP